MVPGRSTLYDPIKIRFRGSVLAEPDFPSLIDNRVNSPPPPPPPPALLLWRSSLTGVVVGWRSLIAAPGYFVNCNFFKVCVDVGTEGNTQVIITRASRENHGLCHRHRNHTNIHVLNSDNNSKIYILQVRKSMLTTTSNQHNSYNYRPHMHAGLIDRLLHTLPRLSSDVDKPRPVLNWLY